MLDELFARITLNAKGTNQFYTRNLIKELIQDYILHFVYQNSDYQSLIFTGGTALRKLYDLDRLSEDLDFDYPDRFDIKQFSEDIKEYFVSKVQYKDIVIKIAGHGRSLSINFPKVNIFVRCDFSKATSNTYGLTKSVITANQFKFLVNAYDLETLFANKIVAFLERRYFKGNTQDVPFKGRDIYDIFWLLQKSAKSSYKIKPNVARMMTRTGKDVETLRNEVKEKIKLVEPKYVYNDMFALVESDSFLKDFLEIYSDSIAKQIDMVM